MELLWTGLVAGATSGSVIAAVLGVILARRSERIKKEIETQFARLLDESRSQRAWKEKCVAELLGPVCMQMDRTGRAFARWEEQNLYLEMKVIREGNLTARDLLLKLPHLIPPDLRHEATLLIEHYDRWLEEFEKRRQAEKPDLETPFIFVGPVGYGFPRYAEEKFYVTFRQYWKELYGQPDAA
jgi:hypothetical protein